MLDRWVNLFGGDRLYLKNSSTTGVLSVYLEEAGREMIKIADIVPVGKVYGQEYEEFLRNAKSSLFAIPDDAVSGVVEFDVNGNCVEVRTHIADKKAIRNPIYKLLAMVGLMAVNEVVVRLNGNEIFNWQ